jgi:microcompartment protein CcmL/EutN
MPKEDVMQQMVNSGLAVVRMENDTMQSLMVQRPRPSLKTVLKAAIDELEDMPEFASSNYYVIPYKERANDPTARTVNVEGLSVKAAMVLQRHYRNLTSGVRLIGVEGDVFYYEAAALDLEGNTRVVRSGTVNRIVYDHKTRTEYRLSDQKLEMKLQAAMSKLLRNVVLAMLPEPLKQTYWQKAKALAARAVTTSRTPMKPGAKPVPLKDRIKVVVDDFFKRWEITPEQIARRYEIETVYGLSEEELGDLVGLRNALTDNEVGIDDAFPAPVQNKKTVAQETVDSMLGRDAAEEEEAGDAQEEPPPDNVLQFDKPPQDAPKPKPAPAADPIQAAAAAMQKVEAQVKRIYPKWPNVSAGQKSYIGNLLQRTFHVTSLEEVRANAARITPALVQQLTDDVDYIVSQMKG